VWDNPAGVKPRCPRQTAVGSDSKNGVRHQRALSPRLSMMMMNSAIKTKYQQNKTYDKDTEHFVY